MKEYQVVLVDKDQHEITVEAAEGLKAAKSRALYLLSAGFARTAGSTHETLATRKAEVRDADGVCVWDKFL